MPHDVTLRGNSVSVGKAMFPVGPGENGEPKVEQRWVLVFTDRQTSDRIQFAFDDEVRDYLVRELTGGIVLAGGDLPKL